MTIINGKIKGVIPAPELTEEEKAMPLYKYYTRPLRYAGPLISQAIDHGAMNQVYSQPTDDLTAHLLPPGEYPAVSLGYCVHPEGGGFIRHYQFYPGAKFDQIKWFYNWINIPCKSQPEGVGNLKYKIWCPIDHFTHAFINGADNSAGVLTQESLGLGMHEGTPYADQFISVRYPIDLLEFGMTRARMQELKDAGCWIDPAVVKFYDPKDYWEKGVFTPILGTNVMISISRPTYGGIEKLSAEWIGWDIVDGKMVRDPNTPWWKINEDWMHMGITHAHTEGQHLSDFLPELYAEYADKPADAD